MSEPILTKGKIVLVVLILLGVAVFFLTGVHDQLTFNDIKENRDLLRHYVDSNYVVSALVFILAVISTAFFVPGAIVITISGGFLFGTLIGSLYIVGGATLGAALAFLTSRYIVGGWVQQRHEDSLRTFNKEMSLHGHNYLIIFRVVPILPFFLVNYLAGLTKIPLSTFVWTTALGMLPGAVIYSFAGQELGKIESPDEIMSARILVALGLLAILALTPVVLRFAKWMRGRTSKA